MRKILSLIAFAAVAAITVIGCSKVETDESISVPTHRVTFEVSEVVTKTAFSGDAIVWSTDDATRFAVTENDNEGTGLALELGSGNATMKLTATFTASSAPYEYKASMSKNRTSSGHPKIPTTQTSTGSTFDPDADILVAKTISGVAERPTKIDMQFARPVVINRMTLKGLVEGETLSSVTVSSDKNITGWYNASTNVWTGQSKEITISTSQVIPASGEITVYFITMPVTEANLTVTALSDNYNYSKTFSSAITFTMNRVTTFGVNMNKALKVDYSGTYAIINGANSRMAKAWVSPNYMIDPSPIYKEGDDYFYDPDDLGDINEAKVTVTKISGGTYNGMYTIVQNGKYLFAPSATYNNLQGEDTPSINAYWDITNTAGTWSIIASKSTNRNIMRCNSSSGVFACYASGQDPVALAPIAHLKPTPVITASNLTPTSEAVAIISVGATFNSLTDEVTVGKYNDAACTEAGPSWLTVSTEGSGSTTVVKYAVSANESSDERVAYIKITATNTSSSRSVNKIISVTQAGSGLVLDFSFTTNPKTGEDAWPTSEGDATSKIYTISTTNYTFALGANTYISNGYLMLKYITSLGLPAINGYKLTKVVATNSSGCSTSTRVGISSASNTASYIGGGAYQTWSTKSSSYTYNLTGTANNTVYYLYVTNKNCQLVSLRLTYVPIS